MRTKRVHFRTSMLKPHEFTTNEFWDPWCVVCHEKKKHPVHRRLHQYRLEEVCGYDACAYCDEGAEPGRGVPQLGD